MGFILVIHVIVAVLLVITILMQAGRGGGLAESFTSAESMFGTQTNSFMVRVATILAIIFIATSMILAINSSKKDKSLMSNTKLVSKVAVTKPVAEKPEDKMTVKVGEPTSMVTPPAEVHKVAAASVKAADAKESKVVPLTNSAK